MVMLVLFSIVSPEFMLLCPRNSVSPEFVLMGPSSSLKRRYADFVPEGGWAYINYAVSP
jgi:hypothetical protein